MFESNLDGSSPLTALAIAIRVGADARDVYSDLAARAGECRLRRLFELLAAEHERHREYLEARWRYSAANVSLELPPSRLPAGRTTHEERLGCTLEEMLDLAMDHERRARVFFLGAARDAGDVSGQAIFRFLAEMAHQHWVTLAQEKDALPHETAAVPAGRRAAP